MNDWLAVLGQLVSQQFTQLTSTLSAQSLGAATLIVSLCLLAMIAMAIWRALQRNRLQQRAQSLEVEHGTLQERLRSAHELSLQKETQLTLLRNEVDALKPFETKLAASDAQSRAIQFQLEKSQSSLAATEQELSQLKVNSSARESELVAKMRAMDEKLALLQDNKEQLSLEFQNLANKIFEEKNQRFNQDSRRLLDSTLSPLQGKLDEFRKKVEETYSREAKERHVLKGEIDRLREESVRISEDANNLTRALKHDNKAQGNWGELSLQRALEMCGLNEGIEFHTQLSVTEAGVRQIPDVVIHLPGDKDIVIDAKMSLLAYTRYFEAETDHEQQAALDEHVASVRSHVRGLSKKNYSALFGINSLDYVMLYIPVEGASMMALQRDPDLWNFAYSRNIVLVGPGNLLAVLRSVETIWRHERQNKNAERIAVEAGKLHDQFVRFAESLEDVGKQLAKAGDAYEKATERLSTGRGNLVKRVETLEKLGAKTQREIPASFKDRAGLDVPENTDKSASNTKAALELVSDSTDED